MVYKGQGLTLGPSKRDRSTLMSRRSQLTRRRFLGEAGAIATGALGAPLFVPGSALGKEGKVAPSNRIAVGFIGTGNQGMNDIRGFLGDNRVQIAAVCDVNRES